MEYNIVALKKNYCSRVCHTNVHSVCWRRFGVVSWGQKI